MDKNIYNQIIKIIDNKLSNNIYNKLNNKIFSIENKLYITKCKIL